MDLEYDTGEVGAKGSTGSLDAAVALADPSRREMYQFIRQARRPVTREEAAAQIGISRKLAAFHLDKLVEVGLLRAHFTPSGGIRRVGRTPKVYEPAELDVRISIPERHPELLAEILLAAVLRADDRPATEAAVDAAREHGTGLGVAERERLRPGRLGSERGITVVTALLARCGYEPHRDSQNHVRLGNCPFQPLTRRAPEVVCGINHAFTTGVVEGIQAPGVTARLAPTPGECCVEITTV